DLRLERRPDFLRIERGFDAGVLQLLLDRREPCCFSRRWRGLAASARAGWPCRTTGNGTWKHDRDRRVQPLDCAVPNRLARRNAPTFDRRLTSAQMQDRSPGRETVVKGRVQTNDWTAHIEVDAESAKRLIAFVLAAKRLNSCSFAQGIDRIRFAIN